MIPLTPREWLVYTFILTYFRRHGLAPSNREIAAHLGKQPGAGIAHTLHELEAKGLITLPYGKASRALALVRGVRVGVEMP